MGGSPSRWLKVHYGHEARFPDFITFVGSPSEGPSPSRNMREETVVKEIQDSWLTCQPPKEKALDFAKAFSDYRVSQVRES
jgi:hypothetical protein